MQYGENNSNLKLLVAGFEVVKKLDITIYLSASRKIMVYTGSVLFR
jgi:hypothetical protein